MKQPVSTLNRKRERIRRGESKGIKRIVGELGNTYSARVSERAASATFVTFPSSANRQKSAILGARIPNDSNTLSYNVLRNERGITIKEKERRITKFLFVKNLRYNGIREKKIKIDYLYAQFVIRLRVTHFTQGTIQNEARRLQPSS